MFDENAVLRGSSKFNLDVGTQGSWEGVSENTGKMVVFTKEKSGACLWFFLQSFVRASVPS